MPIDRREFLAGLGGLGAGLGLGGISHWLPLPPPEVGPDWSPGSEAFVNSSCLLCPSHCGIRGRVVDGKLVRIDGNPLHPVSQGGLCPKGRAGIQLLYHPGRLVGPVERTGAPGSGEFRRVSWEEALSRVATKLGELRADGEAGSVAWLTGNVPGIMGELLQRFARVYGTPHVIREDYADGSSGVMKLCQGIDAPPAFDLAASDLVVSFGAALSEAWWGLPQAARARAAEAGRRPRWVQIDVRHSRTAARADEWVPVRPGTYGTLALGLAYVILKEGLYDSDRLRDQVLGIEDWRGAAGQVIPGFRQLVLRYGRTSQVSERTGVPAETLVRLAKAFGTARRPVAVWDQSVSWRTGGLSDTLAIHALNILVGAVNRPGGVLVQPRLPAPPLGDAPGADAAPDAAPAVPPLDPTDWAARIAAETPGPVKMLLLYHANPVASAPDATEAMQALERVPLVVSFSPFLDESTRYAHLVLPDHTYLERWQDAPAPPSVPIPVWGLVQPMIPPLHDTRATGDVLLDVASRLGGDVAGGVPWSTVEDLVQERGKALASAQQGGAMAGSLRREELRELEARGWWLPHGQSKSEFWASLRKTGGWFDPYYDYDDRSTSSQFPGAKVWMFSAEARRLLGSTTPDLAEGFLPTREDTPAEGELSTYPLQLVPYRVMTLASGGTTLMPWLLENLGVLTGDAWETWAEINPETGRRLRLASGQMVRIESEAGGFRARLRFFAGAQPGVVNVPYGLHTSVEGWGRAEGANPLRAVGARRDPVSGMPDWYSTRVRVIPA
jgi:anaerobic selenocysteine-containing dehydrogenase